MRRAFMINVISLVVFLCFIAACTAPLKFRDNYGHANTLIHAMGNYSSSATGAPPPKPYLKAHLRNGEVFIFQANWTLDTLADRLTGFGARYDFDRNRILEGALDLPIDSVCLFETNTKISNTERNRIAALAILTMIDMAVGINCAANPKACFGSCPTFYVQGNNRYPQTDAEGFSDAIAPSMEYADIDALPVPAYGGDTLDVVMRNEAMETHCVNEVKLLACARIDGRHVYHTPDNRFYHGGPEMRMSYAEGPEGDITSLIIHKDGQERFSLADSHSLRKAEEIIISFREVPEGDSAGLVLSFRQTLMTTYFIYNAMGYMGDQVSDVFALLERRHLFSRKLSQGVKLGLGGIDVFIWDEARRKWMYQGQFHETGPIAINTMLLPIRNADPGSTVRIKLVMNQGSWRLDAVSLVSLEGRASPIPIDPAMVKVVRGPDADALSALVDPDRYLISMPGEEYLIRFPLPPGVSGFDVFLRSKGYYLEWMRAGWLADKNLGKLKRMLLRPDKYLREEASAYKGYEATMEEQFWNSRIDPSIFVTDEH